jgi:hypothetical protein
MGNAMRHTCTHIACNTLCMAIKLHSDDIHTTTNYEDQKKMPRDHTL